MAQAEPEAASAPPKPGRRVYIVDRQFQLKYVIVLAVVGAGVSTLFGAMMYMAHVDAARVLPIPPMLQEVWDRSNGTMLVLTAGMAILMGSALSLFGLLITHRVAGPVYVMTHYIQMLASGRYPVMRPLRKTDELRSFFERFQAALETMKQREADEAQTVEQAVRTLGSLSLPPEASASLQVLRALAERKKEATARSAVGVPKAPPP